MRRFFCALRSDAYLLSGIRTTPFKNPYSREYARFLQKKLYHEAITYNTYMILDKSLGLRYDNFSRNKGGH